MKKIIFSLLLCFTASASFSQCPIQNGNFKTVAICSLTVSTGPFVVMPNATFSGTVTGSNFIGQWNGHSNIASAMASVGMNPGTVIPYSDTLSKVATYLMLKDSVTLLKTLLSAKLSTSVAAATYQPIGSYVSDTTALLPKATAANLYYPKTGNPSGFLTSVPAQSFASLTGKPTTLSGYGITDAYPLSGNPSGFLTSEIDGSVTNEIELPSQTGNSGKRLTTNGTTPSWVAVKRQEPYSGTTNASGVYSVTFGTAYSVAPNIQGNIVGGSNTNLIKITSVSTTGFTVTVVNRVDVIGLLPTYTNVNGAAVDVLITEK